MRHWNWIDHLLLPGALTVLSALAAGLWVRWVMLAGDPQALAPAPTLPVIFGLVLLGALTPRLALWVTASETTARWLVLGLGLAEMAAVTAGWYGAHFPAGFWQGVLAWGMGLSREFVWLFAAPFLWWQGLTISGRDVSPERLEGLFWWGALAVALALAANAGFPVLPAAELFGATLLFFITGLLALALAGAEYSRRIGAAHRRGLALNRQWLGAVAGAIAAMVLLGLGAAELAAPGFGPLAALLAVVADPLVRLLALLIAALAGPVFDFLSLVQRRGPALPFTPTPSAGTPLPGAGLGDETLSPAVLNTVTVADLLILVCGLALAVWWVVRRWRVPAPMDETEVRENIFSTHLLLDQLRAWAARFRPPPAPAAPFLALDAEAGARLRVRRAYQTVLAALQAAGRPRAPAQTPAAYAGQLADQEPEQRLNWLTLAGAYEAARYAAEAPSEPQARQAEQAAEALRQAWAAASADPR